MKTKLLSAFSLLTVLSATLQAQADTNGYTTVNATMGADYQNRVFFDLSSNQLKSQPANTWDIAFYRNGTMAFGTRINDAQNIETYVASTNPSQWDAIQLSNKEAWGKPLYNPDITDSLFDGAFEKADLTCNVLSTGWGCYNMGTHHVDGKTIYVLKYPDDTYIKFMITDYFGGYTFKYSKFKEGTWEETITKTITNGTTDAYFNYYSLLQDTEVPNLEPSKAEWDFMLTRYWTNYNGKMMYRMSGILQSPNIAVAKTIETQDSNGINLPEEMAFKKNISAIGHSWKPTTGLIPDVVYYIKEGKTYYRLYFTENDGAKSGNMFFKYKDITSLLATSNTTKLKFGIYPNPSLNKQISLIYDSLDQGAAKATFTLYDMTGKKVYQTELVSSQSFNKKELNLTNLPSGTYLAHFTQNGYSESKKIILN